MKRHDLDLTSLASGAVFLVIGLVLSADVSLSPRWVIPIVLIAIGAAGLLSTLTAGRQESVATADPASYDEVEFDDARTDDTALAPPQSGGVDS